MGAVRLRGLPSDATEQDVLNFFSKHNMVDFIPEGKGMVRLLAEANGKPTGHAVVCLRNYTCARIAVAELHQQIMQTPQNSNRYIEVFHHDSGTSSPQSTMPMAGASHMPVMT